MTTDRTATEYIEGLEEPRKSAIRKLHDFIRKTAPHLEPYVLEYGGGDMIGYGKYSYETKSGLKGEWFLLGVASRKQGISFYAVVVKEGQYLPEKYRKNFPKAKVGKSCIVFKNEEDIDFAALKKLIAEAVETKK